MSFDWEQCARDWEANYDRQSDAHRKTKARLRELRKAVREALERLVTSSGSRTVIAGYSGPKDVTDLAKLANYKGR